MIRGGSGRSSRRRASTSVRKPCDLAEPRRRSVLPGRRREAMRVVRRSCPRLRCSRQVCLGGKVRGPESGVRGGASCLRRRPKAPAALRARRSRAESGCAGAPRPRTARRRGSRRPRSRRGREFLGGVEISDREERLDGELQRGEVARSAAAIPSRSASGRTSPSLVRQERLDGELQRRRIGRVALVLPTRTSSARCPCSRTSTRSWWKGSVQPRRLARCIDAIACCMSCCVCPSVLSSRGCAGTCRARRNSARRPGPRRSH